MAPRTTEPTLDIREAFRRYWFGEHGENSGVTQYDERVIEIFEAGWLAAERRSRSRGQRADIYQDRAGSWRYRLKARNGEIVAVSEAYTRRSSARRAVSHNHPDATITD